MVPTHCSAKGSSLLLWPPQSGPKGTALSMPCGQDAWQRQRKARLVSVGVGGTGRAGASEPWRHKTGGGVYLAAFFLGGHVICNLLTGRHPQSLIQAAGILPAAQSSVLFPSSFMYMRLCVWECVGVCMCAFMHMEPRGQTTSGVIPRNVSHSLRQSFSPVSARWLVELPSWIRLDSSVCLPGIGITSFHHRASFLHGH